MRATRILTALAFAAPLALGACVPAATLPGPDACGAAALQSWIGRDESVIFATTFANPIRVYGTGDPVTMDYAPNRLNFELDGQRRIARIACG